MQNHSVTAVVFAMTTAISAQVDPLDHASSMRATISRYRTDRALLQRRDEVAMSTAWRERATEFEREWLQRLDACAFDELDTDGRIDWILLKNHIEHRLATLAREFTQDDEIAALFPFARTIVDLEVARRDGQAVDPAQFADQLDQLARDVDDRMSGALPEGLLALRAARRLRGVRRVLGEWYDFYAGYDPMFSWWIERPKAALDNALHQAIAALHAPEDSSDEFRGEPIGREALLDALAAEMIPYTPEELIAIAEREFAWCDTEMLRASRDLGFGDDWKQALEHTKDQHVAPGEQPALIRELTLEAIEFVESRKLVTVPDFCKRSWRMSMMSPARQKTSPYFLGGETIQVSFPTDGMEHRDKLMSMRGNNRHFARATVHHELIPGHHLQGFINARVRPYRSLFRTPFWIEGWALYWECLLWDLEFQRSAEDRVGMLFWRMHRCARIVFSLSYHLGQMTEQQAIDYLVERVGHERNNATAEVRRSVVGGYGPLYQAAYMLGALQLRALRRELVDTGQIPEREFHDAVLRENAIPIELVRASLTGEQLGRDFASSWRFYSLPRK